MEKLEEFYFDGHKHTFDSLIELSSRKYNNIQIKNVVFDETWSLKGIDSEHMEIKDCLFRSGFDIGDSKIGWLIINNCKFNKSLTLHNDLKLGTVHFMDLQIHDGLLLYVFPNLSFFNITATRLIIDDKKGGEAPIAVHLLNSNFEEVKLFSSKTSSKWRISTNTIDEFHCKGALSTGLVFEDPQSFKRIYLDDIEAVLLEGIYDINIEDFMLERCNITSLAIYRESVDRSFEKEEKIDNLTLRNCTSRNKLEFTLTHTMTIELSECKFEEPFVLRSVYEQNHVTSSKIALLDKNSGDILVEHVNVNLNFAGTNFSNITVKDSGINALTFDTFSNHGKINFINSKSSSEEFLEANKYTNHLTANDSILDNINFHFFDLNKFRYIHFVNTNILGMQLFYYPEKLANYSDNLNIRPRIANEQDFNINAKFTYNQFRLLAERNGDIDKAVDYRALEHRYLRRTKVNNADILLLRLNGISNRHGRNWVLGVGFTLVMGIISFVAYQASVGVFTFSIMESPADFIRYIATYPKLQMLEYDEKANFLTDLARLFGIIFMGYGIYQTISAFRKYGKK